jgi:nickel transport protein
MPERSMIHCVLTVVCLLLFVPPAAAHKVKLFATAEGPDIHGYAYYTTGGVPKDATVQVQDRDGNLLAEVTTGAEGQFTFTATERRDYQFALELADGHRASFTVTAAELPDSLPAADTQPARQPPTDHTPTPASPRPPEEAAAAAQQILVDNTAPVEIAVEEIERLVEQAVNNQIRPLREQLEHYEEKIRLHDILGGIGYILGLMGLWAFFASKQRKSG